MQYLKAIYGDEQGTALFAANQSNLFTEHGLAWSLGKECFPYFCQIFLHNLLFDYSGDCVPLSPTHLEIWNELQETILHRNNTRNCYICPRGFGKTTTITVPTALWCALYAFHPFIVVDSSTEKQAQIFVNTMKIQLEDNQYIKDCFGEVINKSLKYNTEEIELDIKPQRTKIQAVASTSSVRGINYGSFRVGLLLIDDGQDEKQLTSDESCKALVSRFNNGIMKTLQVRNNHVIALGTVQRKGDLYDFMINAPGWKIRLEKCILMDDIDTYFSENEHWKKVKLLLLNKQNPNADLDAESYYLEHKAEMDFPMIWENYNCYDMALEYFKDPVSYHQEYQCNINGAGKKRITSLSAISASDIESIPFDRTILSVDPASTVGEKSDYSAFCVMSEADNHIKYARKCIIAKLEFEKYIAMIIKLLEDYPDINALSIEKQTFSGADVIKLREQIAQRPLLRNRTINIINKNRRKNKDIRINAIIPDINMGRIVFNADDIEAIEQIKEFAGAAKTRHDDMIDAVTDAAESIVDACKPVPVVHFLNWHI